MLLGVVAGSEDVLVWRAGVQTRVGPRQRLASVAEGDTADASNVVRSPMHGRLTTLEVKAGDAVAKGQCVAIVEAMKMEHPLLAPIAGLIVRVAAAEGAQVAQGAVLMTIEADTTTGG